MQFVVARNEFLHVIHSHQMSLTPAWSVSAVEENGLYRRRSAMSEVIGDRSSL